ncbi:MAG: hypothetical protein KI791_00835 [Cyclobacteriaceae bacterium]|nr:hypothetical protein [Cyclobacteriaceae bacterium SS2]
MLSLDWRPFHQIDVSRIANARAQLHVAIQNVSAVGRRFLGDSKSDRNATLFWIPGLSRMAGHWVEGNIKFRSSISLEDFNIYLVDERVNTISSFEVRGSNHRKIMLWLEEQIGKLGLSAGELAIKLPYQLKEYPQLNGAPFDLDDDEAMEELGKYYHNSFLVLRELKKKLEWKQEIQIWPHHFDIAISIILKDSGDPETDTLITLGMMPGDDSNDEPYFYVSTWPHVHTSKMKPLHAPGKWIEEDWTGAILKLDELEAFKTEDQQGQLSNFYETAFLSLIQPLTK